MALVSDIVHRLRHQVLVDAGHDFHGDRVLTDMVLEAAREIAGMFNFPRSTLDIVRPAGSTYQVIEAGSGHSIAAMLSVSAGGFLVPRGSEQDVQRYLQLPPSPFPRAWYMDNQSNGEFSTPPKVQVMWGPALSGDVLMKFVYSSDAYPSVTALASSQTVPADAEVWGGLHREWHHVVLQRAAMKAFLKEQAVEQAKAYSELYQQSLQEFAGFLGVALPAGGAAS